MKTTTNVFLDGLTTDMHPLTTKNNLLTDALNATLRTFNGNELVLQNDMGNTMIQDSTTGNIMGLRDGFVPVGMKEYGGILYIASYNQQTGESQLGTIPSPVLNYTFGEPYNEVAKRTLTNIDAQAEEGLFITYKGMSLLEGTSVYKYAKEPFKLSENRFLPGDQFIVSLDLNDSSKLPVIKRNCLVGNEVPTSLRYSSGGSKSRKVELIKDLVYPLISGFSVETGEPNYGLIRFILEAKTERSSSTIEISTSDHKLYYYIEESADIQTSDYWFINTFDLKGTLDEERSSDAFRTYPNILPGYLYVRVLPELPYDFLFISNVSTGLRSPNVFVITK